MGERGVRRYDRRGLTEAVALVDGNADRLEKLLLLPVEQRAAANAELDVGAESLAHLAEHDEVRELMGNEVDRAPENRRTIVDVPETRHSGADAHVEELLCNPAFCGNAVLDLLHEVPAERRHSRRGANAYVVGAFTLRATSARSSSVTSTFATGLPMLKAHHEYSCPSSHLPDTTLGCLGILDAPPSIGQGSGPSVST